MLIFLSPRMARSIELVVTFVLLQPSYASDVKYPFQDWTLSPSVRAADLISRLTLSEKASQLVSMAPGIDRLDWKAFNWRSECCHGWGFTGDDWQGSGWNGTATIFPHVIALASTFSRPLAQAVGDAAASEGRAAYNQARKAGIYGHMMTSLHCFGPTTNTVRDGRWGRIKRTWGEDPFLTGQLATAHVLGLQGQHNTYTKISADLNMFAVHSGPDSIRAGFSARASMQDMMDTYLRGFKEPVSRGVDSIMVAYSGINGVPDNANSLLLTTILEETWGFKGMAFSDNGGVVGLDVDQHYADNLTQAAAMAMNAGLHQDMGSGGPSANGWQYGKTSFAQHLPDAVSSNMTSEDKVDKALMRVLERRFRTGFDDPIYLDPWADLGPETIGAPSHLDLALETSRASVVVLRNDQSLLPLASTGKRILIVGPNANATAVYSGGSYSAFPTAPVSSFVDSFGSLASADVTFIAGCDGTACRNKTGFDSVAKAADKADFVIFVGGIDGDVIEHENTDRGDPKTNWTTSKFPCEGQVRDPLGLPGCQSDLLALLASKAVPVVQVLIAGGPVTPSPHSAAVVYAGYAGQVGGRALAEGILGLTSPAGRLPYSMVKSTASMPAFTDYNMSSGFTYRFADPSTFVFRFGDGLTYTSIEYSNISVVANAQFCQGLTVTAAVTNTGNVASDEAPQIYLIRPARTGTAKLDLVAFDRIHLLPGQRRLLSFAVDAEQLSLARLDDSFKREIPSGRYTISVGGCQIDGVCDGTPIRMAFEVTKSCEV
eukprot:TRINITY_DN10314_c0_g1_i2.p1 TRINITY_DN10314_c0_g1~~TRINITY_DN10314_c0_g1_i2.p1  ORF type:complete len:772 (+),score=165.11 TRINITY_DN10314_c0_g1_i2:86-2401(+)